MNKKFLSVIVVVAAIAATQFFSEQRGNDRPQVAGPSSTQLDRAFEDRRSNVQVEGRGVVASILKDDNDGSRHQRFILKLPSGRTLLIAHNIDLAPRIEPLSKGDTISFAGEYEWNDKGGVLHWTHHDPAGRHAGGWLERDGRRFQ